MSAGWKINCVQIQFFVQWRRNSGIVEAIAEHDFRPKWFIGMVCTKEFGIFIFSGGVSFTKMSLFQPDPYKNVRNPTQIVIYFDGRKSLTFL